MTPRREDKAAAASTSFLTGLDPAALDDVLGQARPLAVKEGAVLFRQGDRPTHLYLLLAGRLKAWKVTPSGVPMTVAHLGPGDLGACVATFCGTPLPATAVATEPTRLIAWPSERILALAYQYPVLAANALRIVGARTADMLRRIEELSTESAECRILRALLRLADGPPAVSVVKVSRQDLAELTATTLHTVSRAVSGWERKGWVRGGRGRITLFDVGALRSALSNVEKGGAV